MLAEDRQNLNKLCEALVNMDVSVEDILNEECDLVDSTTSGLNLPSNLPDTTSSTPEAPPPVKKTKVVSVWLAICILAIRTRIADTESIDTSVTI